MRKYTPADWLPTSLKEMKAIGWDSADVIFFSGDAYIDHPSFGTAVISRWLTNMGLKVAIVPQPNWRDDLRDFKKLGVPNLFFAVSAGNMDSMINHYTANRRLRSDDAFTPGGKAGARPDYAVTVYAQILKKLFPDVPVVIGGIEASLRRLAHYDYWSNSLKPSVLIDSGADLLIYGMGEKPIKEIITRLRAGEGINQLHNIPQTAFCIPAKLKIPHANFARTIQLLQYEQCLKDKLKYAQNFKIFEEESNRMDSARLVEGYKDATVVVNPPFNTYTQEEIDAPYQLAYTRMPHPRYHNKEPIPAYEMIRDSVNIHRGCFGACSFCTIAAHQGKQILSRSEQSVIEEVKKVAETPGFRGHLSDLGGPSANMYNMRGLKLEVCQKCKRASCIYPSVCKNLNASHQSLINLYKKVSAIPGIKKMTIGSGIRYDLFYGLNSPDHQKQAIDYLRLVTQSHVSGRLKVAPEHSSERVLKIMRKPPFQMYLKLKTDFESICKKQSLNQQITPYLISGHPGSTVSDMAEMAIQLKQIHYYPEQVQDFTPTPMTLSTAMYYTGVDPYTMKKIYTALSPEDKKEQILFLFYYKPENQYTIRQSLLKIKRQDLLALLYTKASKSRQ